MSKTFDLCIKKERCFNYQSGQKRSFLITGQKRCFTITCQKRCPITTGQKRCIALIDKRCITLTDKRCFTLTVHKRAEHSNNNPNNLESIYITNRSAGSFILCEKEKKKMVSPFHMIA